MLDRFDLEVQHLDGFLMNQLDRDPARVIAALHRQANATRHPALTTVDLLERLERCGNPTFAEAARRQLWRGMLDGSAR